MSLIFLCFAAAMLIAAIGFVAVPLRTGKSLFASPTALVAVFIPLLAVGLYALLGSPDKITTMQDHSSARTQEPSTGRPLGTVGSMVEGLAERLTREPDDADGWILLARSYEHLGRHAEALDAYRRAEALGKVDTELEASIVGKSASGEANSTSTSHTLRGRVALTADAAARVQPGDTVFIFAKESRDHRMPVVALRKRATELPLDFILTDKEVMVPGTQLKDYEQLVVTAKISRSGNASDNALGLEAWSDSISPSENARIDLLIGESDE